MTSLEQAAKMYVHAMSTRRIRTAQDIQDAVQKGFTEGAEWQQKQDESVINDFFSREAVIAMMYEYRKYIAERIFDLDAGEPLGNENRIEEWLNTNYPPSKSE